MRASVVLRILLVATLGCALFASATIAGAARTLLASRVVIGSDNPGADVAYLNRSVSMSPDGKIAVARYYTFFNVHPIVVCDTRAGVDAYATVPASIGAADPVDAISIYGDWIIAEYPNALPVSYLSAMTTTGSTTYRLSRVGHKLVSSSLYGTRAVWTEWDTPNAQYAIMTCDVANAASRSHPTTVVANIASERPAELPDGKPLTVRLWGNRVAFEWAEAAAPHASSIWTLDVTSASKHPELVVANSDTKTLMDYEGKWIAWRSSATPAAAQYSNFCDTSTGEVVDHQPSSGMEIAGEKLLYCNPTRSITYLFDPYVSNRQIVSGANNTFNWNLYPPSAKGTQVAAGENIAANYYPVSYSAILEPTLTAATAASTVSYGSRPRIYGNLSELGAPVVGASVELQSSDDNVTWRSPSPRVETTTSATGAYTVQVPASLAITKRVYWRTLYWGSNGSTSVARLSAQSRGLMLTAPCIIGKPSAPASAKRNVGFASYGTVKPALQGPGPLLVDAWRYERGKWRYKKSFTASSTSTIYKYRAYVKLPYTGSWKLRAHWPKSAVAHPEGYSAWSRTITVK